MCIRDRFWLCFHFNISIQWQRFEKRWPGNFNSQRWAKMVNFRKNSWRCSFQTNWIAVKSMQSKSTNQLSMQNLVENKVHLIYFGAIHSKWLQVLGPFFPFPLLGVVHFSAPGMNSALVNYVAKLGLERNSGENILPFKPIIIWEKFLQKGSLGKIYREKLKLYPWRNFQLNK